MAKLLFVGNSHLASFKKACEAQCEGLERFERAFVPLNFVSAKWNDRKVNKSFRHFQIEVPGQPVRVVDFAGEIEPLHLVFVGRGLGGDGMVRCHGSLTHNKTPVLPETSDSPVGNYERAARLSTACLWDIYESGIRQKLIELENLATQDCFASVHWVLGPDMTKRAGVARFGEEMVESGHYAYHCDFYAEVFEKVLGEVDGGSPSVIRHPAEFRDYSGFTQDQFVLVDRPPEDIHVSPDFFRPSLNRLSKQLEGF